MFAKVDQYFIAQAGKALGHLQERHDVSPPLVLKESLTGGVVAYAALLLMLLFEGPFWMLVFLALSIPFSAPSVTRLLRRYTRDAQKEWSSDLGRTYIALAIGRQESMRTARAIYICLSAYLVFNTSMAFGTRGIAKIDVLFLAMTIITLVYEYLSAAEPKPPGDRRRATRLTMAHSHG
ncbi:MAG: hypothetical protein ACRCXM_02810 [Beijerinckiaceae bacterium]